MAGLGVEEKQEQSSFHDCQDQRRAEYTLMSCPAFDPNDS